MPDVVVIGGGPAGSTVSTLLAQQGVQRRAVRARALSALSHRRIADPRDLLGAEAARHAAEDAGEPLRQEVQRAVRQRQRQAVGAVLFLGQQAARVLADLAGGAQRVRPDAARERPRARRGRARRRARVRRHLRGRPRRRRHHPRGGRHAARGPRQGRRRRQRPGRPDPEPAAPARLGPDPQQGRDLDLLGGRLSRHRPRRGRDDGAADGGPERLVLVHPAARQHRLRRRGGAVRLPVQEPRQLRGDLRGRSGALPGGEGARRVRRRGSPATSRPRTTPTAPPRSPATAG